MVSNPMRDPAVTVGIQGDSSGATSAIDGVISKLGDLRNAVGLAGGALAGLAGGGLAAATSAAADFEEQMVEVEKVTSPDIAAEMSDRIREMASEMPVAQEELAGIAAQAGRFGVEGSENIEQFTESVSKMAVATDLSTEEAGEAFARMSTLMDEPIENIENVGDAVNGLSNNMATSASEITNASTRSSGALSQLGLESDSIMALNASMNEVSASSRIAGTRLRRFAQELQDPGKVEDLASALGMSADEFRQMREESPNEVMEMMVERFNEGGEAADDLRSTLSTTSRQALAGLAQNTEGWADAQEIANEQMGEGASLTEEYEAAADTFNNKVQVLRNRVLNVAIGIGEDLLPAMTDLVEMVTGAFDAFDELNESMDINVGTIALVSTLIAGLTATLVAFGPAIAGAAAGIAAAAAPVLALAGAIGALWVAWEENLFGIQEVVDDVMGEVMPIFEEFQAIVGDAIEYIGDIFDDAADFIEDNSEAIEGVLDGVMSAFSGIADTIQRVILPAVQWAFGSIILPIFEDVADAVGRNLGPILEELGPTIDAVVDYAETLGDVMLGIWNSIDGVVVPIVEGLGDVISNVLGAAIDAVADGMQFVMNLVQGDFSEALNDLQNALGHLFEPSGVVDAIKEGVSSAVDWLSEKGEDALVGAFEFLTGSGEDSDGLPGLLVDGIKNGIDALGNWIADKAWDAIDFFSDLADFVKRAVVAGATLGLSEVDFDFSLGGSGIEETVLDKIEAKTGRRFDSVEAARQAAEEGEIDIPGAATGGFIERGGMLNVHAGEQVVQAAQVTDRGQVEAGPNLTKQDLVDAFTEAWGSVALALDVDAGEMQQLMAETAETVVNHREGKRSRSRKSYGTKPGVSGT